MFNRLSYSDYCQFYAEKCSICHGAKRVLKQDVWTACLCQHTASVKWRLEQFEVSPIELKYKSWQDFTGTDGRTKLTDQSFVTAKKKALQYCFGSDDPSVIQDRAKNLLVHKHSVDGQNVIIAGNKGTGRTLIAVLIVKEVAHACRIHNLNLTFKCVKSSFLHSAARWDNSRPINHAVLDELSDVDFLVIDGVELVEGGHTTPPDMTAMNTLFAGRAMMHQPTIIVCSESFWTCIKSKRYGLIERQWGSEFISIMENSDNMVIELLKEVHHG